MTTFLLITMLIVLMAMLLTGFPVAFVLAGVSLIFAGIGHLFGVFDTSYLSALPNRIYGIMTNDLLMAVPLFVFMGCMLERAKIAEELLENMARVFGKTQAGLPLSVMVVGTLLAASTGIVGATVVTMGMISLPSMLRHKYSPRMACGTICAAGTLGQIIPPSIVLILLGDQISNAWQTVQMKQGALDTAPVSIADIFVGAITPGLMLVALYIIWLLTYNALNQKQEITAHKHREPISLTKLLNILLPPLCLIVAVLGSILTGLATATESAAIGAVGAMVLAFKQRQLTLANLQDVMRSTTRVSSMVFTILIGAAVFTLVFRGYGGDILVEDKLAHLPGGLFSVMFLSMAVMFFLGFFLDFIEIIFVVVPIVAPTLLSLGANPIWLAIMIAMNLQTSFLTPPFGFSLFYLRGVAPKSVKTTDIYRGVIPFVLIQLLMLAILAATPRMATWLPEYIYGTDLSNSSVPAELPMMQIPEVQDGVDF